MNPITEWISNASQTLIVIGFAVFIVAAISFLISSGIYLMRNSGSRLAWFVVVMVGIYLGAGLKYGIPGAVSLLVQGLEGSVVYLPQLRDLAKDVVEEAAAPWREGSTNGGVTFDESDVTIVATPGWPGAEATPTPTTLPSTTPTVEGVGGGVPTATTETTRLTNDEIAATSIVEQQLTATFTPRPPTAVPTINNSTWNPMTPAPTPVPNGGQ